MKIIKDYPPNIAAIRDKFQLSGREIFTFGETVFNPQGVPLSPELEAHESVHVRQQGTNPEAWWEKYLVDAEFRYQQELEAHRVEYQTFCRLHKDRNKQAMFLQQIALRLASPMYGSIITSGQATKAIRSKD